MYRFAPIVLLSICSTACSANSSPTEIATERSTDANVPTKQWRFPVRKIRKTDPANPEQLESNCNILKNGINKTKRHSLSKKLIPGTGYIKSIEGNFYHIRYKNQDFTVYKDVRMSFDRRKFPNDPYKNDAPEVNVRQFFVIPGREHNTTTHFQSIVFSNPFSEIFFVANPNLREIYNQPKYISDEMAEMLSAIFNSRHGFFGGNSTEFWRIEPELSQFRGQLGIGLEGRDWLVRYLVDSTTDNLPDLNGGQIDLFSNNNDLYIYQYNKRYLVSYLYQTNDSILSVIKCTI